MTCFGSSYSFLFSVLCAHVFFCGDVFFKIVLFAMIQEETEDMDALMDMDDMEEEEQTMEETDGRADGRVDGRADGRADGQQAASKRQKVVAPSSVTCEVLPSITGEGDANSTKAVRLSGLKLFNKFLIDIKHSAGATEGTEKHLCNAETFGQFAHWLVHTATKKDGEGTFMAKTALMYFSTAKEYVLKRFSNNKFMKDDVNFTKIRMQMAVQINRKRILAGLPINEKSQPVGRSVLLDCMKALIKENTSYTVDCRMLLACAFAAAGRAGEVGMTRYSHMFWNSIGQHLHLNWQQVKVLQSKEMTFFNDAICPELCVFFNFFCFRCSGKQARESIHTDLVFPQYEHGCATKMSDILKRLRDAVPTLPKDVSATCLRVGATEEILRIRCLNIVHAIRRGGWALESIITMLEYAMCFASTVSEAGKGLCGYRYPLEQVFPPSLAYVKLNESDNFLLLEMMKRLFNTSQNEITNDIPQLCEASLATWLMWFPYWTTKYGYDNSTTNIFLRVCRDLKVTEVTVNEWSKRIKAGYDRDNAVQANISGLQGHNTDELLDVMQRVSADNRVLYEGYRDLNLTVSTLVRQNNDLVGMNEALLQEVKSLKDVLVQNMQGSPSVRPVLSVPSVPSYQFLADPVVNTSNLILDNTDTLNTSLPDEGVLLESPGPSQLQVWSTLLDGNQRIFVVPASALQQGSTVKDALEYMATNGIVTMDSKNWQCANNNKQLKALMLSAWKVAMDVEQCSKENTYISFLQQYKEQMSSLHTPITTCSFTTSAITAQQQQLMKQSELKQRLQSTCAQVAKNISEYFTAQNPTAGKASKKTTNKSLTLSALDHKIRDKKK